MQYAAARDSWIRCQASFLGWQKMTRVRRSWLLSLAVVTVFLFAAGSAAAQDIVFEDPVDFAPDTGRFPQSVATEGLAVVAWQRISEQTESGGIIDIALATSRDGKTWEQRSPVASGITYEGTSIPPVYSLAISQAGDIVVAVTTFEQTSDSEGVVVAQIYRSGDGGESFTLQSEAVRTRRVLVAPRLFQRADGGWFLFFEHVYEGSDSRLVLLRSEDGTRWEDLAVLPIDNRIQNQVDIQHEATGSRDLIVFSGENFSALNAGLDETGRRINELEATFHLFGLYSDDGGMTWSAVDPANDDVAAPRAGLSIDQIDAELNRTGREAVEELGDDVIPYWYIRTSNVGLPSAGVPEFGDIVSRRPDLVETESGLFVAWEAGILRDTDTTRQIVVAGMDPAGNLTDEPVILSADGLSRSRVRLAYNQPGVHEVSGGIVVIAYSDPSRRGEVVLYERGRFGWQERQLSQEGIATFPTAVALEGHLHAFWQERESDTAGDETTIVYLPPDQTALPPVVSGENYEIGERSRASVAEFSWEPRPDAAGIAGYSYVWSRDRNADVPKEVAADPASTSATFEATEDGEWYFHIRAVDRLGNWSDPTTTVFFRDTTPPGRVTFDPPTLDEDGYLASNTFALSWNPPTDDIVEGYSYDLVYVAPEDAEIGRTELPVPEPPERLLTTDRTVRRDNFDNGFWALSVAAIDSVGNVGDPAVLYVRMNKYVPVTLIFAVTAIEDSLGRYSLEILGRGFTANGNIIQVILDRDQAAPYDYVYDSSSEGFRIFGDRSMRGPLLDNIETGSYALGLVHAERGLTWASRELALERNGTIKFGDFTVLPGTTVRTTRPSIGFFGSVGILAWVIVALLLAVVVFTSARIVAVVRDGRHLRLEARALITSRPLPSSGREKRIEEMKKRGIGLRAKFAFSFVALIMAVVAMLAVGLGSATLNNQRRILLQGLNDNVDVLMESIVSGAANLLPEPEVNLVGLSDLPRRTNAMDGALYATISGRAGASASGVVGPDGYNYVWGTNDPLIRGAGVTDEEQLEEIAGSRAAQSITREPDPSDEPFTAGVTRVEDPLTELVNARAEEIDREAREALGNLPRAIEDKAEEIVQQTTDLALTEFESDEALAAALEAINRENLVLQALNDQLNNALFEVVGPVRSYPEFDPQTFTEDQRDFVFYQVVTYLPDEIPENLETVRYSGGVVRLGVSTDLIVQEIADARNTLVRLTILIAAAAIAAGVVGALLLAAIVVSPINRLVRGVETISETADKRKLEGHEIQVRSRDELSRLADTVNTMTAGLVAAAKADEELKVSSDMQKMFMPLESEGVGPEKRQLTSAHAELGVMEFHGYYEGADALSGDYFSYEQLDEKRYALIKCDVAGHGVEAAIIMVEVATIFLNQLRDWRSKQKPVRLTELLITINDLVEERGFQGKFAAMTVGILDIETGRLRISHAGDNLLQVYRAEKRQVEKNTLNEAPATGMFPMIMFPPGQEFAETSLTLNPGDVLLLATDGIDESMRMLRDANFKEMLVSEEQDFVALAREHGWGKDIDEAKNNGYLWDSDSHEMTEEFTLKRMHTVIESVLKRGTFELTKALNPTPDERLLFDFKNVEPSAASAVLGLMAVEKVFRLLPDPSATERDMVRVDRKIADFLRKHFTLYARYFRYEVPEDQLPETGRAEYVWFSHLREETQRDDLTILGVRRK